TAEARAGVTMGSPFEASHGLGLLRDSRETIEREGEARVDIGGRPFQVKKQFLEDIEGKTLADAAGHLGKALLVMHSPRDTIVNIDNASKIFLAAKHPKSFVSLDTADHLLTRRGDAHYAACVLAAWAERYLG